MDWQYTVLVGMGTATSVLNTVDIHALGSRLLSFAASDAENVA